MGYGGVLALDEDSEVAQSVGVYQAAHVSEVGGFVHAVHIAVADGRRHALDAQRSQELGLRGEEYGAETGVPSRFDKRGEVGMSGHVLASDALIGAGGVGVAVVGLERSAAARVGV